MDIIFKYKRGQKVSHANTGEVFTVEYMRPKGYYLQYQCRPAYGPSRWIYETDLKPINESK